MTHIELLTRYINDMNSALDKRNTGNNQRLKLHSHESNYHEKGYLWVVSITMDGICIASGSHLSEWTKVFIPSYSEEMAARLAFVEIFLHGIYSLAKTNNIQL